MIPSLNGGEQAQLEAKRTANSAMDHIFGVGPLTKNDELTLHSLGKDWFGNGSEAEPAPEGAFSQILEMPSQQSAVMGANPMLDALSPAYDGLSSQGIIHLYNPGRVPQTLDPAVFASRPAVTNALIPTVPAVGVITNFLAPSAPAMMPRVVPGIPASMLYGVATPAVPASALSPQGSWR